MPVSVITRNDGRTPRLIRMDERIALRKERDKLNLAAIYYAQPMLERLTDQFQRHCNGTIEHDCGCAFCVVVHP